MSEMYDCLMEFLKIEKKRDLWKSKAEKLAEALKYYKETYDDRGFDGVAAEALAEYEKGDER